eukprot:4140966-Pyramimonas_sp.AAC.1
MAGSNRRRKREEKYAHQSSMVGLPDALWGACPTIAFKLKAPWRMATMSKRGAANNALQCFEVS